MAWSIGTTEARDETMPLGLSPCLGSCFFLCVDVILSGFFLSGRNMWLANPNFRPSSISTPGSIRILFQGSRGTFPGKTSDWLCLGCMRIPEPGRPRGLGSLIATPVARKAMIDSSTRSSQNRGQFLRTERPGKAWPRCRLQSLPGLLASTRPYEG